MGHAIGRWYWPAAHLQESHGWSTTGLEAVPTARCAAEANIAKVTDKTIVIPGHGAVGGKADVILFRDVLVDIRDKVAALKKQGKLLPEVVAAKPVRTMTRSGTTCFRIQVTSLRSHTRASEIV